MKLGLIPWYLSLAVLLTLLVTATYALARPDPGMVNTGLIYEGKSLFCPSLDVVGTWNRCEWK